MNDIKETISRLEKLKSKAQEVRDNKVRLEAQLDIAQKERERLLSRLSEQDLDFASAQEKIDKIVTAVNTALDKVELFLDGRK